MKVQIFFLINSALIGFIIGIAQDNTIKIIGCITGLIITAIWYAIQLEAQYAIDYWNNKISEIEQTETIKGFSFEYPHEGFHRKYFSTHYLILTLVFTFAAGWLILIILL